MNGLCEMLEQLLKLIRKFISKFIFYFNQKLSKLMRTLAYPQR